MRRRNSCPLPNPMQLPLEQEAFLAKIRRETPGLVARTLNKPISFAITRRLVGTFVTPNQITVVNLGIALVAVWCLASRSYPTRALGAILMQLSSILDGCDGEVARLKDQCSKLGAWLDTVSDDLTNNLFFLGIMIGLWRGTENGWYLGGGIEVLLASLGMTAIIYHYLITIAHSANATHFKLAWERDEGEKKAPDKFYEQFLKQLLKRDFFIFFIAVCVLLDVRIIPFAGAVVAVNVGFGLYAVSFFCRLKKS